MAKIDKLGEKKIKFRGQKFEIINQEVTIGNKTKTFEWARRAPGVRIIIHSPNNEILIIKEFRYEHDAWDYRLPGGKVFDNLDEYNHYLNQKKDIDEAAKETAKKEANEEVGIDLHEVDFFHKSACGATVIWDLYYFISKRFEKNNKGQTLEFGENIEINWFNFEKIKEYCLNGKFKEERTVGVLLKYLEQIV